MSKIFTESHKWKDSWFRGLSYTEKLFWLYLLDNCDYAGIYEEDLEKASFDIGLKITDKVYEQFSERVFFFEHTKQRYCVIKKFIEFQYKWLKEDYNPHKAAFKCIEKYSYHLCLKDLKYLELSSLDQGLTKACPRLLDMDKDKGIGIISINSRFTIPTVFEIMEYCKERKNRVDPEAFHAYYEARGWVPSGSKKIMKSWKSAIITWEKNNYSQNTVNKPKEEDKRSISERINQTRPEDIASGKDMEIVKKLIKSIGKGHNND